MQHLTHFTTRNKSLSTQFVLLTAIVLIFLSACKKDKGIAPIVPIPKPLVSKGIYILNEGLFQSNNTTLDYYDNSSGTLSQDVFGRANSGKKLGDTGNDVEIYGSRLYIVMNGSNTVEVARASDVKSLGTISLQNAGKPRQPRSIVFNKNLAFVSCFDGTVQVIDTASLQITKSIQVGRNPEKMAISGNKLYVANSGGLSYPNYDTTVSVIDLGTLTEIKKITVPLNPTGVSVDQYGKIYIVSNGDYAKILPSLSLIDPVTDLRSNPYSFLPQTISLKGDSAYVFANDPVTSKTQYLLLNIKSQAIINKNFISDGSDASITAPFSLKADPITGNIYISDAKDYTSNGQIFIFDRMGKKLSSFAGGLNPGFFALYSN